MHRWRAAACAAVIALVLTACNPGRGEEEEQGETVTETMTQDEAAEKAQEHVDGVMAALPEGAELEGRGGTNFASCDDPTDGGPKDRVIASVRFWIRGVPVEDNDQVMDAALEYWTENGFWIIEDARPDDPFISVGNEEDAFGMSIKASIQGDLSIGASSPCVWPEGSPGR